MQRLDRLVTFILFTELLQELKLKALDCSMRSASQPTNIHCLSAIDARIYSICWFIVVFNYQNRRTGKHETEQTLFYLFLCSFGLRMLSILIKWSSYFRSSSVIPEVDVNFFISNAFQRITKFSVHFIIIITNQRFPFLIKFFYH